MDYKELIACLQNAAGGPDGVAMCHDAATAITDLLSRAEVAEERTEALEMSNRLLSTRITKAEARCALLDEARENANEACAKWEGMYRMALERAENAESIASDLCDDFTDFVTSGVYNAAPYCANYRAECVNAHGWCNGNNKVCRGFMPKAAVWKEE